MWGTLPFSIFFTLCYVACNVSRWILGSCYKWDFFNRLDSFRSWKGNESWPSSPPFFPLQYDELRLRLDCVGYCLSWSVRSLSHKLLLRPPSLGLSLSRKQTISSNSLSLLTIYALSFYGILLGFVSLHPPNLHPFCIVPPVRFFD